MTGPVPLGARRPVPSRVEDVDRDIPITDEDRLVYSGLQTLAPVQEDRWFRESVAVTLTVSQWAVVMTGLRAAMAFAKEPGVLALAHQEMYPQIVRPAPGTDHHRQHADGNPEGER